MHQQTSNTKAIVGVSYTQLLHKITSMMYIDRYTVRQTLPERLADSGIPLENICFLGGIKNLRKNPFLNIVEKENML